MAKRSYFVPAMAKSVPAIKSAAIGAKPCNFSCKPVNDSTLRLMQRSFVITIDQGTTGSRVFLIGRSGEVLASAYEELPQYYPQAGWVEHNAEEIWHSVERLLQRVFQESGLNPKEAASIGITNQRETTVLWDRSTGQPVHNAIVWQCRRTAKRCDTIKVSGKDKTIREKTGLIVDAYFSATKLEWLLEHVPGAREKANLGELAFGTIDSFLLYRLTGGASHMTDYTNASRTMLFNIHTLQWDPALLELFGIPAAILPEAEKSASHFGKTKGITGLPDGIPITALVGDQQSALYGQMCHKPGEAKNTYGTGAFLMMNLGDKNIVSTNGLVTTLACNESGDPVYALEGSVFIAGALMQWLRDELNLFDNATESEKMAESLSNQDSVVFVPALTGLGAPHWDPDARGAIYGITRDTTKESIVRAALKSLAFQSADVLTAMEKDSSIQLSTLRVDGGAAANNWLMQFQADILATPVERPANTETTVLGAAYLSGLASEFWENVLELENLNPMEKTFQPGSRNKQETESELSLWQAAVKRTLTR